MQAYDRLETEEATTREITDHSAAWDRLEPVGRVNGSLRGRIEEFALSKQITMEALDALGTRVQVRGKGPEIRLAWACTALRGGRAAVTAVKFRDITSGEREALKPSVYLQPSIIGNRSSLDWFVGEGETDAARLFDLVGDVAAILCLPAGAKAFKREWADQIPRGATVHLCHDADQAGDEGAEKAARIIGGKTVRVRPPTEGGDWCDFASGREEFVEIVRRTRAAPEITFLPARAFLRIDYPRAEPLLGSAEEILYLARGALTLLYGDGGSTKSTLTLDVLAHLAAGRSWIGIPVPRPVRCALVENEGAAQLFQQKLRDKAAEWDADPSWLDRVFVYAQPWGGFSFAESGQRAALAGYLEQNAIDVVFANPLFGIGGPGSGKPDETNEFLGWLKELGLTLAGPAFWLLHHENKLGQVSGDWRRQPDTLISLSREGDEQRTKLIWEKVRWTNKTPEGWRKKLLLDWVIEHKGFAVSDIEIGGASDPELQERLDAFLLEHPDSSAREIMAGVKGTDERLRKLLNEGVESGRYDREIGPRRAQLHRLAGNECVGTTTQSGQLWSNPA